MFIINDYKNFINSDLDASNLKKKPAKFYYSFNNVCQGKYNKDQLTADLNNFIGLNAYYENPIFFKIENYMNKSENINDLPGDHPSIYMKFYEHIFTYHLYSNIEYLIISIFTLISIPSFCIFFAISSIKKDFSYITFAYFIILFSIIILYIIYKCLKSCYEKISRIDCIYSKDFDRIFIGLVKYTENSYVNTFEFEMNNIDRFILEDQGIKKSNLKVIFKNNEIQHICTIRKRNNENLEGLTYLLNERLIDNTDNINAINFNE